MQVEDGLDEQQCKVLTQTLILHTRSSCFTHEMEPRNGVAVFPSYGVIRCVLLVDEV